MPGLVGLAVVVGVAALVVGCDPKRQTPTPDATVEHADRPNEAARLVARRKAGDQFTRKMREVGLDIRVTTHGKRHTVLRLSGPPCGTQALADFARESAQHLRAMGFEHLECRGRFERAEMDL